MAELDCISTNSTSRFSAYTIGELEDIPRIQEFNSSLQRKNYFITNDSGEKLHLRRMLEKMKKDLTQTLDDLKEDLHNTEQELELALAERNELSSNLLSRNKGDISSIGSIKIGGSLARQTSYKCIMQQLNESRGL